MPPEDPDDIVAAMRALPRFHPSIFDGSSPEAVATAVARIRYFCPGALEQIAQNERNSELGLSEGQPREFSQRVDVIMFSQPLTHDENTRAAIFPELCALADQELGASTPNDGESGAAALREAGEQAVKRIKLICAAAWEELKRFRQSGAEPPQDFKERLMAILYAERLSFPLMEKAGMFFNLRVLARLESGLWIYES